MTDLRLRNDLYCVGWGVKIYSLTHPACPHGTSAMPECGATRHTSQQSSELDAAAAVADSNDPEVVAAGTGA